jgi:hypothetical protein
MLLVLEVEQLNQLVHKYHTLNHHNVRRFLFQTALASGAPLFPPFMPSDDFAAASRRPLPVFATSRGRNVDDAGPAGVVVEDKDIFSPILDGVVVPEAFAARKVLFTDTDLKDANFLTLESVRKCPLPSTAALISAFEASVSDPPLTLTSAEATFESIFSVLSLKSSLSCTPFIVGTVEDTSSPAV